MGISGISYGGRIGNLNLISKAIAIDPDAGAVLFQQWMVDVEAASSSGEVGATPADPQQQRKATMGTHTEV